MEKNVKVLHESPDYFQAGIEIEKSMKAAKVKLIRLVFDDFKDEMEQLALKYGLELEREANYYSYEEKRHEKFYDYDGSTYPGLNYIIKRAEFKNSSLQMWFRIEVEDNLFAGIALFDTEAEGESCNGKGGNDGSRKGYQVDEITHELMEEAAQFLDRDIMMPVDWWLAWCYSNGRHQAGDYHDVPNFKKMNRCAVELVDPGKRKEFVRQAAGTFEEKLLKYLIT